MFPVYVTFKPSENKLQMSVTFHRCEFLNHRKSIKGGSDVDNIHHGRSGTKAPCNLWLNAIL